MSGEAGGGETATGEMDVASAGGGNSNFTSFGLKGHRAGGRHNRGLTWFFEIGNGVGAAEVAGPFRHFGDVLVCGDHLDFGVKGLVEPVFVNESGARGGGDSEGAVQDGGFAMNGGDGSGADNFVAALTEIGGQNPDGEEDGLGGDLMDETCHGGAVSGGVMRLAFLDAKVVVDFELGKNLGLSEGGVSVIHAGVQNGDHAR